MIVLHTSTSGNACKKLEERLHSMVVAFQKVEHKNSNEMLPYIEEDGQKFVTKHEIDNWLLQLGKELNWSRSLSGDGCYVDPKDGKVC